MPAVNAIAETLTGAGGGMRNTADEFADAARRFQLEEAGSFPAPAAKPLKFFHGGRDIIQTPRATIDSDGLLEGFSVTPERGVAEMYANMRGGNAVTEFAVDPNKLRPIGEFELYDLQNSLELARGLDEGDLADADLLAELRSMGINAVEYSDPEFGIRVLDPSILSPSNPAPAPPAAVAPSLEDVLAVRARQMELKPADRIQPSVGGAGLLDRDYMTPEQAAEGVFRRQIPLLGVGGAGLLSTMTPQEEQY